MWIFKHRKAGSRGFSLVEIVVVMTIVSVLVAIAVPTALQQRKKSADAAMKADILKVATGMQNALSAWNDVPPADVAITFASPTWSIVYGANTIVSGTVSTGDTVSGTVWADGSYCAQVVNSSGSNNWIVRSDTGQVTSGTCPSTALGGVGSLPTSTAITLPTAPGNLTVVNTSGVDNSIDVSWTAVSGATSYIVNATGVSPITVTAPSVSTTITNIAGGDTTVSVRAVNSAGSGQASTTNLTINGGSLFTTGVTTPLTAASGQSGTLERVQIGTTGIGIGGSSLTSDASTIKFATNSASATAAWIAGRADGGINFYTQNSGGSIINNLSLTTTGNTFNNDVSILSATAATSSATGALKVTGGTGIGGNLYVGGNLVLTGTCTGCPGGSGSYATITDDTATNATYYPTFATATSGSLSVIKTSSSKLTYNPSTGSLSAILTGSTGLPIATGLANIGAGVPAFLTTPTSANLSAALTNESGSGLAVFNSSPALTTPTLTGTVLAAGTATTGPLKFTPSGSVLLTTPVAGNLEVDSSGVLYYTTNTTRQVVALGASLTNPMTTLGDFLYGGVAGATTRLGGNVSTVPQFLTSTGNGSAANAPTLTSSTGSGNVVLSNSPTITAEVLAAGTTGSAPLKFTPTGSSLLTTPVAGALEVDSSGVLYYTTNTTRQAVALGTSLTNPMTTLGDFLYGGAAGAATRLPGNITTTPQFLTSTGAAGVATAPTLTGSTGTGSVVLSNLPTLTGTTLAAGTAANGPLRFTPIGSTLLTTPVAGALEVDSSGVLYYTTNTTRQAVALGTPLTNPMTTLGDFMYGGVAGAATRLPGNTTTTPQFLSSTGASGAATAPTLVGSTGTGSVVLSASPVFTGTVTIPVISSATASKATVTLNGINGAVLINTGADANGALVLRGNSSTQSGDLIQWQNNSSTVLARVDALGNASFANYGASKVRVATAGSALTANYSNGASGVGATLTATTNVVLPSIDGVSPSVGDRILVKDQATVAQNGVYSVTSLGTAGTAPWVLTRSTDSDTPLKVSASLIGVDLGTANAGTYWTTAFKSTNTVGIDSMTWSTFSAAGSAAVADDTSTNASYYLTLSTVTSGNLTTIKTSSTKLTFNPSTGLLSTTGLTTTNDATINGITIGKGGGSLATNTALGLSALSVNLTGANNTAVGQQTLTTNQIGNNNTGVGYQSLFNNIADNNTGFGLQSLYNENTGTSNTGIGISTLFSNVGGNYNTALGYVAGYNNNSNGSNDIFIGSNSGPSSASAVNNQLYIGNVGTPGTASGTALIGGTQGTTIATSALVLNGATVLNSSLTVRAVASQSTDLIDWQNSAATTLALVDINGNAAFPNINTARVKAASTADIGTATYANGTAGNGATLTATTNIVLPTVDGVSLAVGDRVLLKNQTAGAQNGIYSVTSLGAAGTAPWVLTRAPDANSAADLASLFVTVDLGTANTSTIWKTTFKSSDTVGTTSATFTAFTSGSGATVTITDDTATNATYYPALSTASSGTLAGVKTSSTKFTFNPSNGFLAATIFGSTTATTSTLTPNGNVGGFLINTLADANKGLVIKDNSGTQSANPFEVQDSSGNIRLMINPFGQTTIGNNTAVSNGARLTLNTVGTSSTGLVIQGVASQTGDLLQLQDSASNILARVDSAGNASFANHNASRVKVATTGALAASTYANGTNGIGATLTETGNGILAAIDGYTPVNGDRILVKNQATQAQNGIYTVTTIGTAGTPWVLTRSTDSDTSAKNSAALVGVDQGTTNTGTFWSSNFTSAFVMGTNNIVFSAFTSGSGGYTAPTLGSTLIPSGTTVSTIAGLTLTTPTIDSVSASSSSATNSLWGSNTTGTINIGALVGTSSTTGTINIGAGLGMTNPSTGTLNLGVGALPANGVRVINIGTGSFTNGSNGTINIGSASGQGTWGNAINIQGLAAFSAAASFNLGLTATTTAALTALTVKGAASQTGDLTQWQDSASNILARIDSAGNASFANQYSSRVKAASTAALTVTYANGTAGVGATLTNAGAQAAFSIDGYTAVLGDRILIKDQATGFQNGIYTVTNIGSGSTNWVLTRSTDSDTAGKLAAGLVAVDKGTTNTGTYWKTTFSSTNVVGTDGMTWTPFTSGTGAAATITDDNSTNASYYVTLSTTSTGSLSTIKTSSAKLTFNPSTGVLSPAALTVTGAAIFNGSLTVNGNTDKVRVRVATTGAGTLATSFANGQVVDGVTLATGDRILIKNQATGSENGIYTVNASGAPTRATDADLASKVSTAFVAVDQGTTLSGTYWYTTFKSTDTVGTTAMNWVAFGTGGGAYTAPTLGSTLIPSGSTVSIIAGLTLTTPTIDQVSATSSSAVNFIWANNNTGSIAIGGGLTTGLLNLATGVGFNGTVGIASGAGTVSKTINIGTLSTAGTTAITLGSVAGATSTIALNGLSTFTNSATNTAVARFNAVSGTSASPFFSVGINGGNSIAVDNNGNTTLSGNTGFSTTPYAYSSTVSIYTNGNIGLGIRGSSSQASDLTQWTNNGGSILARVDALGNASFTNYNTSRVKAASTASLTVTYANGTAGSGATLTNAGAQAAFAIDGYTAVVGDRILIKDQATPSQNGVYSVTNVGSGSTNWVLTRSTDSDNPIDLAVATITVDQGTTNSATTWKTTFKSSQVIGTDPVTFASFGLGAAQATITDDTATNATYYPALSTTTSGSLSGVKTSSTRLSFNPSTGSLAVNGLASNNSNIGLSLGGVGALWFVNSDVANGYNPTAQAGDKGIFYNNGSVDTGSLVIAPWSATSSGLRMDSSGNTTFAGSVTLNRGLTTGGTVTGTIGSTGLIASLGGTITNSAAASTTTPIGASVSVSAATINSTNASNVLTNAASLYIAGPPVAGTNTTFSAGSNTTEKGFALLANGNISVDGAVSTSAAPRIIGFSNNGNAGNTEMFRLDAASGMESAVGARTTIYSYWGIQLSGNRQVIGAAPGTTAGAGSDASVLVQGSQTASPVLSVQGVASQTGDLTQWQNSSATVLARVDSFGNASFANQNASRVKVASTADMGAATYANGTAGVGATLTATTNIVLPTVDGISLAVGDRVLLKNQTTAFQNGIYSVTSLGSAGVSPWILTRSTTSDTNAKIAAAIVGVDQGTTNSGSYWSTNFSSATSGRTVIGTDSMTWVAFGAGASNPLTTLGDIMYGGASGTQSRLAGNTTTTPQFLTSTGSAGAATAPIWTNSTGSGSVVLGTSPVLTTPNLGTPSTIVLTSGTGLPISTGVSGLGSGVATFLGSASSANLAAALTDETGTGNAVFSTNPVLTTPNLGVPSFITLTNGTGLPISTGVSGLGSGVATFLATANSTNLIAAMTGFTTGTSNLVFSVSPTLSLPIIDNVKLGYATTATAGGTTTLTSASVLQQYFTGTLTQTVVLPVTSTLALGESYIIANNSTGLVTVQSSGLNTVATIPTGTQAVFTVILTSGTTASSWNASYDGVSTIQGTGSLVLNTSPNVTDPKLHVAINPQVGTTYTFVLADDGKLVTSTNSSAQTFSIPTNASVAYPIGTQINVIQLGTAQVTVNAVTPGTTTIISNAAAPAAPKTRVQYSSMTLIKLNTDQWYVVGDIV